MNLDPTSWESNRWRGQASLYEPEPPQVQQQHQQQPSDVYYSPSAAHAAPRPPHPSRPSAPQLSAPSAVNPATYSAILDLPDSSNSWIGKSRETLADPRPRALPRLTEPYATTTDASTYHSRLYERHSPNYGPTQLANTSPRETSTGSWRSLHHDDRRMSSSHITDAPPLTLHIPQVQDLPRISPPISLQTDSQPYSGSNNNYLVPTPSTSLPSFAAFQEHTTTRPDDVDGPEIAPMSSRLSCQSCTKLQPWVRDVAVAVAELDQSVQTHCNKTSRSLEIPNEGLIRLVQWILDRLRNAKDDLQDASQRNQHALFPQQRQGLQLTTPARNPSPPNPLKRPAERWERDEQHVPKRPRSGVSVEHPFQLPAFTPREDRRTSIDFAARDPRTGFSPPPTESLPGSAHPRQTSPTFTNRTMNRALPSPSSLVYPPSAAPSLPAPTGPSIGSPATSYQPASSIHSTSTNAATSAHIADLQHQVTLKSLALQTLQSEYASLLQKLQRERVKSQTIEKKTSVADQEVNDLTSKNEEMTEQVKSLESQLEDSEKKRESIRADAAKEKEQWGRMLEMGGRLHAKVDSERQRLLEEKEFLTKRVAALEQGDPARTEQVKRDLMVPVEDTRRHAGPDGSERLSNEGTSGLTPTGTAAGSSGDFNNSEATALKREVLVLNGRIEALRFALEEAKRHNQDAEDKTRAFLESSNHLGTAIDYALKSDDSRAPTRRSEGDIRRAPSSRSTPARGKPAWSPPMLTLSPQPPSQPRREATGSKSSQHGTLEIIDGGKSSIARIADVARAKSPTAEELGIQVTPSTSSPEELIKALGPVPAPLPSFQFVASSSWAPSPGNYRRDNGRQAQQATEGLGHHVPLAGYGRSDGARPTGTSPRSYHSSPGEVVEEGSSGSGSGQQSPDAYTSEPEPYTSGWNPTNAQAYPLNHDLSRHSYQHGEYRMPPPPRPEMGASPQRG